MTIAITGATGFVGQAVLDRAIAQGRAVRALTRRDQADRRGVAWVRGDLSLAPALSQLVQGVDAVIHIAGVVNAPDHTGFYQGNVAGTQAALAAAREAGVRRFVHVSSLAAREPQLSLYGKTKMQAEQFVQESGLDWTIVRPPAVYGPRDTEIFELFKAARWGIVPLPPAGRTSIIHVDDLARLLLSLADLPRTDADIYEPDDGQPGGWAHADLARAIGDAVGKRVRALHVPRPVLMGAARLDRILRGKGAKLTPDRASYMAHPDWTSDPARQVPAALWKPQVPTRQGLADTARWYRQQGWL